MSVVARLARLERRFAPPGPPRGLTVFYLAVAADEPTAVAEA